MRQQTLGFTSQHQQPGLHVHRLDENSLQRSEELQYQLNLNPWSYFSDTIELYVDRMKTSDVLCEG
jgi:hypothetical protein